MLFPEQISRPLAQVAEWCEDLRSLLWLVTIFTQSLPRIRQGSSVWRSAIMHDWQFPSLYLLHRTTCKYYIIQNRVPPQAVIITFKSPDMTSHNSRHSSIPGTCRPTVTDPAWMPKGTFVLLVLCPSICITKRAWRVIRVIHQKDHVALHCPGILSMPRIVHLVFANPRLRGKLQVMLGDLDLHVASLRTCELPRASWSRALRSRADTTENRK